MTRLWEWGEEALDRHTFVTETELGGGRFQAARFADRLAKRLGLNPGIDAVWSRDDLFDEHALHAWCDNTDDDGETIVAMLAMLSSSTDGSGRT